MKKLEEIQKNLKAPKNQYNSFRDFNYRSCEDILEAVKPLLGDALLTLSDDIIEVGGRVYVRATAKISCGENSVSVSAFAREPEEKKGMDDSQITGSASSYARKYALNGLFCIDDAKDADSDKSSDGVSIAQCKRWIDEAFTVENLNNNIWPDIAEAGHGQNASVRSHFSSKLKKLKNESL